MQHPRPDVARHRAAPTAIAARPRRSGAVVLASLLLTMIAMLVPTAPVQAFAGDYEQVLDITFPTLHTARFSNDYHAPRGGGTRVHKSTDIIGDKFDPVYSVVDGYVCYINGIDAPMPSWGYSVSICDEHGHRYAYLHMNNDNPGTDDGKGGPENAYAPGIVRNARVARGQLIGWMGDSGNAEWTVPHIHFEIHDERVVDPYGDDRINPYHSLVAAIERNDVPDGSNVATEPTDRVYGRDRIETALALAHEGHDHAESVILAPHHTPAQAIVAGPLADHLDAPVLTTSAGGLDERVAETIRDLGAGHVVLVGAAFSEQVVADLIGIGIHAHDIVVLAGQDQLETATIVAEYLWSEQGVAVDQAVDGIVADLATDTDSAPVLIVSEHADRSDEHLLHGARVAGDVHVHAEGIHDATSVTFWVDDPDRSGVPHRVESFAPYDLNGSIGGLFADAAPWDTTDADNGEHRIDIEVLHTDGDTSGASAVFTIANEQPRRAIVAKGNDPDPNRAWPDSLMASYYGATLDVPVFLIDHDTIPAHVLEALDGADEVTLIGGTAAIDEVAERVLGEHVGVVRRLSGPDRFATALAVTDDLIDRGLITGDRVWAATGLNWPDAATAGSTVARAGDAFVLVNGLGGGGTATETWLRERKDEFASARAIGGAAAVRDDALTIVGRNIL